MFVTGARFAWLARVSLAAALLSAGVVGDAVADSVGEEARLSPSASALSTIASEKQQLVSDLERASASLETGLAKDDVKTAEEIYRLERTALHLLTAEANASFSNEVDRVKSLADTRAMVGRILRLQDRVKEFTQDKLDIELPGEPGRKLWTRTGKDLYKPLFRLGTPDPTKPEPTSKDRFAQMKKDFYDKGGKDADIAKLSTRYLSTLKSGKLAEWVQVGDDQIRLTTEGAKHPVIAGGRSARGAGSLKVYKNDIGEIILAVVSHSSGNFKPGSGTTEGLVQKLIDLGVPESHIAVTSVIPEEPELVKLLLKAKKTFSKDQISEYAKKMHERTSPRRLASPHETAHLERQARPAGSVHEAIRAARH